MEHLEQITIFLQSSQLEKHFKILKTKHSLPSPFVVLSSHSLCVVFVDPHQVIDNFAFFLSTSEKLMWSSGRGKYENIFALHIL